MSKPIDIDGYIAGFPPDTQAVLEQLRTTIRANAVRAEETISYAIPAFKLNGKGLIYFAGYKHHVSLYPIPKGDAPLQKALAPHKAGKGTLRFMLDRKLPLPLIARIVKARVKEAGDGKAATKRG